MTETVAASRAFMRSSSKRLWFERRLVADVAPRTLTELSLKIL